MLGRITADQSIPQLRKFVEAGGTLFTVGSSTALAYHLGLPIKNALVTTDSSGREQPLSGTQFYAPGSVHQVMPDPTDRTSVVKGKSVSVRVDRGGRRIIKKKKKKKT